MTDDPTKGTISRRALLAGVAVAPAITTLMPASASANEAYNMVCEDKGTKTVQEQLSGRKGTSMVLLGTGAGPVPGRARHMTSVLLKHDDRAYILDFGLGAVQQFARTGVPFSDIRSMFLTHMHPDHNVDYGPFLLIGWIHGLRPDVQVYGPPSMGQMTKDYLRAMKTTIDFWHEDFKGPSLTHVDTHDMADQGPVMQDDVVKVTSMFVQHPPVKPAFAFKFEFPDKTIVFSGDTVPLDRMAKFAKDADILVHEAMYMPGLEAEVRHQIANGQHVTYEGFMHHMNVDHSPVQDVGRIAEEAGVSELVLYHLTPSVSSISDAEWTAPAAKYFKGRIIVGADLMVI